MRDMCPPVDRGSIDRIARYHWFAVPFPEPRLVNTALVFIEVFLGCSEGILVERLTRTPLYDVYRGAPSPYALTTSQKP